MKRLPLPPDAADRMRTAPVPGQVGRPADRFDLTGFVEALLVEHARDLGVPEEGLRSIVVAMPLDRYPSVSLAHEMVASVRQLAR
jgi:hypothetical protein